jgi:hypothetical protein
MFHVARSIGHTAENGDYRLSRRDISENSNVYSAGRAAGSGIFALFRSAAEEFFSS